MMTRLHKLAGGVNPTRRIPSNFQPIQRHSFLINEQPEDLPINTSKNGLNEENQTYYDILKLMVESARPLIDFLARQYDTAGNEYDEKLEEVSIAKLRVDESQGVKSYTLDSVPRGKGFLPPKTPKKAEVEGVTISFRKPKSKADTLKKALTRSELWRGGECRV